MAEPAKKIIRVRKNRYLIEDGTVCLELSLKHSGQLFDARDPSPFIERDLDDDAVDYLISSAQEFSLKTPVRMRIYFTQEELTRERSDEIRKAIGNYFQYMSELLRKKLSKTLKNAQYFLLIGITVLVACLTGAHFLGSGEGLELRMIVREGVVIVGWVAMWRPVEVFLFDWWPLYERVKTHEKLSRSPVDITYRPTAP